MIKQTSPLEDAEILFSAEKKLRSDNTSAKRSSSSLSQSSLYLSRILPYLYILIDTLAISSPPLILMVAINVTYPPWYPSSPPPPPPHGAQSNKVISHINTHKPQKQQQHALGSPFTETSSYTAYLGIWIRELNNF